jgi:nucleoside-diphosphate-sugar epimerase
MHVILGAGGPVSDVLAGELISAQQPVRLVSRKPVAPGGTATWMKADLLDYQQVVQAVQGATVVYLCAGLQYNKKIWKQQWPLIMRHVIDAVKQVGARLIFFDNVYMYGYVKGVMTEDTPHHPCSVKGEIRAGIADMLMREIKAGNIRGSIARSADFYGARMRNSFFDLMVLAKYAAHKKAQWIGNPAARHSLTYVPDAGKALFLLGQHPESDNQVWHMPTAPALTGEELMRLAAETYGVPPKYTTIGRFMLRLAGVFNSTINEVVEMYYQNRYDYVFDSSRFEKTFGYTPVSYREGMRQNRRETENSQAAG